MNTTEHDRSVQPEHEDLHDRGPAVATRLPRVRRLLATWARRQGMTTDTVADLALACYEAMSNVVAHAYNGEAGSLDVRASRPNQHVVVTVTDRGRWRTPSTVPDPLHGRGLPLIRSLSDHAVIESNAHGTAVRMRWNLPAAAL